MSLYNSFQLTQIESLTVYLADVLSACYWLVLFSFFDDFQGAIW